MHLDLCPTEEIPPMKRRRGQAAVRLIIHSTPTHALLSVNQHLTKGKLHPRIIILFYLGLNECFNPNYLEEQIFYC